MSSLQDSFLIQSKYSTLAAYKGIWLENLLNSTFVATTAFPEQLFLYRCKTVYVLPLLQTLCPPKFHFYLELLVLQENNFQAVSTEKSFVYSTLNHGIEWINWW